MNHKTFRQSVSKCEEVKACGDTVMYKLELQDVTKRMRARSSAVKKGKCLCSLWNEVRPVLIAPSGSGAPGAEKTLKIPNVCSLYSIFVKYVLVHYCLKVSVFALKCHV